MMPTPCLEPDGRGSAPEACRFIPQPHFSGSPPLRASRRHRLHLAAARAANSQDDKNNLAWLDGQLTGK